MHGLRHIVEMHASTHRITSGWWNSGEGIMDAMISSMSKGWNGINEKGEEGTTVLWIKLKLVLDLWQNVEMPPHTWDNYLTGVWWNPGKLAMGANERRTKRHHSKMEEGMSGYIVVSTVACSGWCQTGCPDASTHVLISHYCLSDEFWWESKVSRSYSVRFS